MKIFFVLRRFPGLFVLLLGIGLYNFDTVYKTETRTAYVTMPQGRFSPFPGYESTFSASLSEFWGTTIMCLSFGLFCAVDFFTLRGILTGKKANRAKHNEHSGHRERLH